MIEEHIAGFDVSSNFIYRISEFLVMLSHDTLHSKQVIKVQDLIKHCDLLLASGQQPEIYGNVKRSKEDLSIEVISSSFSSVGIRAGGL